MPRLPRPHHGPDVHLEPQRGPAGPGGPCWAVPPRGRGECRWLNQQLVLGGAAALNAALSDPFQKESIGDLLIVSTQLSQAGLYSCTAQTVVDSASASAKLVVRGERLLGSSPLQTRFFSPNRGWVRLQDPQDLLEVCW